MELKRLYKDYKEEVTIYQTDDNKYRALQKGDDNFFLYVAKEKGEWDFIGWVYDSLEQCNFIIAKREEWESKMPRKLKFDKNSKA
jgi:hypothetical protein